MFEQIVPCLAIGTAISLLSYCGAGYCSALLDFAEHDMAEKLKRLQAADPQVAAISDRLVGCHPGRVPDVVALGPQPDLCGTGGHVPGVGTVVFAPPDGPRSGTDCGSKISWPMRWSRSPGQGQGRAVVGPGPVDLGRPVPPADFGRVSADCRRVSNGQAAKEERTLDEAKQRLHSENFALFAAAIQASRQSGGRLNETIEQIAIPTYRLPGSPMDSRPNRRRPVCMCSAGRND